MRAIILTLAALALSGCAAAKIGASYCEGEKCGTLWIETKGADK